jgi:hypothetical protein
MFHAESARRSQRFCSHKRRTPLTHWAHLCCVQCAYTYEEKHFIMTKSACVWLCALSLLAWPAQSQAPAPSQAAQGKPASAKAPVLKSSFAFQAHVNVDKPLVVGQGPQGLRRVVPITGGSVSGPKLNGKVLPGGADWQYVRADGTLAIEAKYTLQADDGTLIMITNRGVRRGPKDVIDKLARGEPVDPSLYYFRTVAELEAPADSAYAWLNQSIFVGVAERQANAAIIKFFAVE